MNTTPLTPAMATSQSTALAHTLTTLFPTPWLHAQARALGVIIRQRKVDGTALFWVLVFGFGLGKARSVASLRRAYAAATGVVLSVAACSERFTPALTRWLRAAAAPALQALAPAGQALPARLAAFRDLVLADATVIRWQALLARAYPACRTNHTQAAAKLHVVLSVAGVSPQRVRLISERRNERRVLRLGPWVAGRLLVMDLGYFQYALFARIAHYGGYFLSRLQASANPTIVAVHRRWRGQARAVVGQPLQVVLARLQRAVLDVEVVVAVRHRWERGRRHSEWQRFRVVAVRHPQTGTCHVYLTNIPPTQLSAEDLHRTYAARWLVEVLIQASQRLGLGHYRGRTARGVRRWPLVVCLATSVLQLLRLGSLHLPLPSVVWPWYPVQHTLGMTQVRLQAFWAQWHAPKHFSPHVHGPPIPTEIPDLVSDTPGAPMVLR